MPPINDLSELGITRNEWIEISSRFVFNKPIKKAPKKSVLKKFLSDVSEKNKELFDKVAKVQLEIDKLEKDELSKLMYKHDTYLFAFINKKNSIKDKTNTQISAYLNTLQQSVYRVINDYMYRHGIEYPEFENNFFSHISRFVTVPPENTSKFKELSEDLWVFSNSLRQRKEEKKKLIGISKKDETVCEDYLNEENRIRRDPVSIRFEQGATAIVGGVSLGSFTNSPF